MVSTRQGAAGAEDRPSRRRRSHRALTATALVLVLTAPLPALAETLQGALVRAYQANPVLNAERARQRGTDENVSIALSGYRPQIAAGLSPSLIALRDLLPGGDTERATLRGYTAQLTITQVLFNGFRTGNQVRQAEAQVLSGREALRGVEQSVLLDAVTAYMNVVANQSLVEAQRVNVTFLRETLGTTRKRLDAGDVTPTDVAQAEARLARGNADLNAAEVSLAISQATYEQVVGTPPGRLANAEPIDRLLPRSRDESVARARRDNPAVTGATYDIDVAQYAIKIAEGSLYPTLTAQAGLQRDRNTDTTLGSKGTDQAFLVGRLDVPIYDGGQAAAQVRQSKEVMTQARMVLDRVRTQTNTAAVAAWVTHEGAKVALSAAEAEVRAATLALEGVQREAQAGQRTTLEVLNSQQDLTLARSRLILAQRDRVVASYTLLSTIGRLDHKSLGLGTSSYEPQVHYQQVRDAWHGLRTPDGK
ncbi:TolC family outer membrane protein [Rhodoplanes sp. TEM]|uniref:TolC family outer membrane protein n=1 Tax=Rhodoplanes tepidamans TaxID=200616 RepID=A0ABT5JJ00_RHOTP|nr:MULTISPECIES: TolC family outer membrane protein [Rhodoplanes]MDC7789581.1 TolC family outer membrane protein [Rhodoplanes tepidamans]MDC7986627.1 TolC family outer membrane protein [Rhodoplanes sp. TEM]MDQ0357275.1 outer membrane protein [Rhodoplanes tepidamans]